MDTSKEELQRKEFRDILFNLASNQELLRDKGVRAKMYSRLEALYGSEKSEKPFRHFYSDIFSVLTAIRKNTYLGDINVLGQNLSMIREKYTPGRNTDSTGRKIDISDSIRKLYDHVSLDIARITYSEEGDRKTSGEEAIMLYGLFYYVNHLIYNNKKISATLIILANCLMLLLLALVFASWFFGVVERRNGMFG